MTRVNISHLGIEGEEAEGNAAMSNARRKRGTLKVLVLCSLCASLFGATWKDMTILSLEPLVDVNETPSTTDNTATSRADFLTFTRIPKTGSTSLLGFLRDFSGLESFNSLLHDPKWLSPGQLKCMFAPLIHNDTQ